MAGHSKWANIKHRKGAQDKKRAKQFTRAIKEITVAIKEGNSADPETNPTLRNAIANAKGVNMPKDTIERAIKKASGADADNYEQVTFEGYGPYGIAIFVECTTDNTNRTVASVRSIFSKNDGSLGTNGSLEFLFDKKGVFNIETTDLEISLEELELELIEAGATDFEKEDEMLTIFTEFESFGSLSAKLEEFNIEVKNAEVQRIPLNTTELPLDQGIRILALINKFEEDDDVQNVYHTLALTDELMQAYEAE
ncbi:YebC/PmpR family DNA-binding transcriptional regulator [Psychroflexus planctonicus]|uniref:Probable transcriptional regulatory protein GCM10010832_03150 n=1 Tax=Psychroflexus planctonicus TaxID=1526575 RepID=A0ABQ1SC07_9FLAO|nr:YebC/PmpR family DNA-binding transcriptional regulator [Psychroflexus planctonicus]GGE25782.1 putative transcriptional regulatory protein [Psychroflexus planctonicus]